MKIKIRKKYLKRNYTNDSPVKFHARQPNGVGTDVQAIITIAPVLRKHPDLRKPMVKHEVDEIKHWAVNHSGSHDHAKGKEPKLTRNIGGVSGFWKEIKRRENKK